MPTSEPQTSPRDGAPAGAQAADPAPESRFGLPRVTHLLRSMAGLPPHDVARWLDGIRLQIETPGSTK